MITKATSYCFRDIHFTINDDIRLFHMHSDWGSFSCVFNCRIITLTDFLPKALMFAPNFVARKLFKNVETSDDVRCQQLIDILPAFGQYLEETKPGRSGGNQWSVY